MRIMLCIFAILIATAKSECFSGSYSGFPAINYNVDVNVGPSTTTVMVTTDADEPVGIGFGGQIMDGTYAVIIDDMGPKEVELYGTAFTPRGFNYIMTADNWVYTDITAEGTRTITMTRDNSVSCTECFEFVPTNVRLNIVYAIASDDDFTGHLFRGGDRLEAVPCPTTTTPAPITPDPTRRRRQKSPAPTTFAPTTPMPTRRIRGRKGGAAKAPGKGAMITTTTTAAPRRTKSPRTTKTPRAKTTRARSKTTRARSKGRTPSPTPMPTEECDCYTTKLVGRQVIGSNKCYKYEVDFCKPGMNSIILGDGNADTECGIMDMMDIITNVRVPDGVTYETTYVDKVRGLKIDGLMSGDKFRVCFDKDVVDGVMKGGFIEYQSYYGDVSCKQSGTLPDLCPLVVSNAKMPKYRTPSPTPNPTKGVRVKTTRARMKTTRMKTKTTRMRAKTTRSRVRSKTSRPTTAEPTSDPTLMPTQKCDCFNVILVSRNVIGSNKCYRYEVDFCNDDVNSITLGDGNADVECGVDFMDVMTELDVADDVTYSAVYNEKVRGLKLNGLMSGDRFRVCYDKNVVDNTLRGGFIEYMTDSGDFSCKQSNNLPDLCPTVVSNAGSGGAGKLAPCSCNEVKLLDFPFADGGGESCYQYRVNFCNDNYNSIEMGMGNPEGICDTKIEDVFTRFKTRAKGVRYEIGRPFDGDKAFARGITISRLSDGDTFTLCFDGSKVYGARPFGTIDFLNPKGREENCNATDTLFDLCPEDHPPFSAQSVNNDVVSQFVSNHEDKNTVFESPTMIYIWSALCSALISMAAIFIVYVSCIAPKGGINMIRGYGKVMDSDDDESEKI